MALLLWIAKTRPLMPAVQNRQTESDAKMAISRERA
jgi:hypothetical protein